MKSRFELNPSGVRELLKSSEMSEVLNSYATDVQSRLGGSYQTDTKHMGTRVIASVFTEDPNEIKDAEDNNSLWGAI